MSDKTWVDELAEAGLAIAQSKHGQDAELTPQQALAAALENIVMLVDDPKHRTWQGIRNVASEALKSAARRSGAQL